MWRFQNCKMYLAINAERPTAPQIGAVYKILQWCGKLHRPSVEVIPSVKGICYTSRQTDAILFLTKSEPAYSLVSKTVQVKRTVIWKHGRLNRLLEVQNRVTQLHNILILEQPEYFQLTIIRGNSQQQVQNSKELYHQVRPVSAKNIQTYINMNVSFHCVMATWVNDAGRKNLLE